MCGLAQYIGTPKNPRNLWIFTWQNFPARKRCQESSFNQLLASHLHTLHHCLLDSFRGQWVLRVFRSFRKFLPSEVKQNRHVLRSGVILWHPSLEMTMGCPITLYPYCKTPSTARKKTCFASKPKINPKKTSELNNWAGKRISTPLLNKAMRSLVKIPEIFVSNNHRNTPPKTNMDPKIAMFERRYSLKTIICGIYVRFRGG